MGSTSAGIWIWSLALTNTCWLADGSLDKHHVDDHVDVWTPLNQPQTLTLSSGHNHLNTMFNDSTPIFQGSQWIILLALPSSLDCWMTTWACCRIPCCLTSSNWKGSGATSSANRSVPCPYSRGGWATAMLQHLSLCLDWKLPMIQASQALRLECWGKLGQDQVKLLALPHGAELVLALIKKDAGREPLSNIANASRCSLHHSRSWNTFTWISRPRAWSSYPSCPSFSASASASGTQGCYREVLGWEMVERWRQLAAIHSGPSVLALRILWRVHMRAQAVAFRKTAPDIPDIPGKWSRYEKATSWDITWNRRMCPNGQLQPSRSIVGADERTSTQNFALLWLNLRCRYGRPLCAKRHVPSEVMDGK